EAERSFRQVAKLQPDCAMAYWGMALANVESVPRAVRLIATAVKVSAAVPRYEQLWIEPWASYYRIDDAVRDELRSGDDARVQKAVEALVTANEKQDDRGKRHKQRLSDLGKLVFEFPED